MTHDQVHAYGLIHTDFTPSCHDGVKGGTETGVDCGGICKPCCTDNDSDGYKTGGASCTPVDCNDNDAAIHPGATEVCDNKDNDCDGQTNEGLGWDIDGDGHYQPGSCYSYFPRDDCNDIEKTVYPEATELCTDNLDNNCNGEINEGCCPQIVSFAAEPGILYVQSGGAVRFHQEIEGDYDTARIVVNYQVSRTRRVWSGFRVLTISYMENRSLHITGGSWDGKIDGRPANPANYQVDLVVTRDGCTVTKTTQVTVMAGSGGCARVPLGSSANLGEGSLHDSRDLFAGPAGLDATLYYDSATDYAGALGLGWRHSLEYELYEGVTDEVLVIDGRGRRFLYRPNSSSGFVSQPGDSATLVKNADDSFTRTHKDGTRELYAATGQLLSITDRNGNALTLTYADDRLEMVSDNAGRSIAFAYDSAGHLASIADPAGQFYALTIGETLESVTFPDGGVWRYGYAANAFLTTKTDPLGHLTTYSYDDQHRVVASIDPEGRSRSITYPTGEETVRTTTFTEKDGGVWQYTYDTVAGDLLAKSDPLGNVTTYSYDAAHNQTSKRDASGTTTALYDVAGNLTEATDVAGQITRYSYNAFGQVTSITSPEGGVTRYDYDERGNLIATTDVSGATTSYSYDSAGRTLSVTAADGAITRMGYDAQGNLNSVTDPSGAIQRMEYDASGRMIQQIDPQGGVTTFEYDPRGNLIKSVDPLGNVSTAAYDANGRKASTTDAGGQITRYEYNAQGQVVKTIDAMDNVTTFTYGGSGCPSCGGGVDKLTALTDAREETTAFAYDPLGRLSNETDPLGHVTSYTYDPQGHLATKTDANGNTIRYSYDALGRLVKKVYPDGSEESFSYDAKGNILSAGNPAASYTFSYDSGGKVTSVSDGNSRMIQYEYDSAGRKAKMIAPDGKVLRYLYDSAGRLSELRNGGNYAFAYDTLGRRSSVTYPNGIVASYAYDNGGRLTSLTHKSASGRLVARSAYTLDPVGNRLSKTSEGETLRYRYDDIYRLITAAYGKGHNDDDRDDDNHDKRDDNKGRDEDRDERKEDDSRTIEAYRYDPVGNRLSGPQPSKHQADAIHDDANRLLEDRKYRYSYDNNGNLIAKIGKNYDDHDESWSYRYDYENRLIEAVNADGHDTVTARYAYDPFGRRVEKRVTERDDGKLKTKVTRYLYDNEDILFETDEKGKIGNRYIHGPGIDEPLALVQGKETYYYHADGLGSIVALTDKSGKVVQDYQYDSFGNLKDLKNRIKQPYTYTGREYDRETGQYYYRARYYDAVAGRFTQKDPIGFAGGDMNLYGYVSNMAVTAVDPFGKAYFAYRPLSGFSGIGGVSGGWLSDITNTVRGHEQLFFEDNLWPPNIGFFADSTLQTEVPIGVSKVYNQSHDSGWNDCVMREAVKIVKTTSYVLIIPIVEKFNCQDWADSARNVYRNIVRNQDILQKCCPDSSEISK